MVVMSYIRRLCMIAAVLAVAGCATANRPGEARIPDDAKMTHRAVLIGSNYSDTVGTVSLYQSKAYPVVVFETNFKAPEISRAVVALGRDGYRAGTSLGALLRSQGRQAYAVPDHLRIDGYNEVWLWNTALDKAVGLARLTPI